MRSALLTLALVPRNLVVLLIHVYRRIVSPLYGDVCRYHPSCSGYALQAVQRHGLIRGVALSAWRILRCNPWAAGGVDDVPGVLPGRYRIARGGTVVATTSRAEAPEPPAADTAAAGIAQNRIASA